MEDKVLHSCKRKSETSYQSEAGNENQVIAQMYNTTPQNITMHIKNIYEDGELDEESTCKEFLQVQIYGLWCIIEQDST